jgi:hypothetical protein
MKRITRTVLLALGGLFLGLALGAVMKLGFGYTLVPA